MKIKSTFKKLYERLFTLSFLEKPLPRKPFGKKKFAEKEEYIDLHKFALKVDDSLVKKFEEIYGHKLDKAWWSDLALHTQVVIKKGELNFFHGRLLYSLLSKYIDDLNKDVLKKKPITILETGTARGFSSICMSKALIDKDNPGLITTIDCIAHDEKMYWNCIDDCDGPITRNQLLEKWDKELSRIVFIQGWTNKVLPRLGLKRINFAFLDGQHSKSSVIDEFKYISKRQLTGDIIVFDDFTKDYFPGVYEAIKFIKKNYPYEIKEVFFTKSRGYAIAKKINI